MGAGQPGPCDLPSPGAAPSPRRYPGPFVARYARGAAGPNRSPAGSGMLRSPVCADRPPVSRRLPCSKSCRVVPPTYRSSKPLAAARPVASAQIRRPWPPVLISFSTTGGAFFAFCAVDGVASGVTGSAAAVALLVSGTGSVRLRSSTTVCVFCSSWPGSRTRSDTISFSPGGPSRKMGTTSTTKDTRMAAPMMRSFKARSIMIRVASIAQA